MFVSSLHFVSSARACDLQSYKLQLAKAKVEGSLQHERLEAVVTPKVVVGKIVYECRKDLGYVIEAGLSRLVPPFEESFNKSFVHVIWDKTR